jgi:hypothetical protein
MNQDTNIAIIDRTIADNPGFIQDSVPMTPTGHLTEIDVRHGDPSSEPDQMDVDTGEREDRNDVHGPGLCLNSLLLSVFPWYSGIPMTPISLADQIGVSHYALVRIAHFSLFSEHDYIHLSLSFPFEGSR